MAATTEPIGAPVPGCPTSMRITGGAPGGRAAWRALAAAITSMTMNGGALAPRPIFSTSVVELDAGRLHTSIGLRPCHRRDAWCAFGSALLGQAILISGGQGGRIDLVFHASRRADVEFARSGV